jgi:hypothetical protein
MQTKQFFLRTGFGESSRSYGGSTEHPTLGLGQGNAAAGPSLLSLKSKDVLRPHILRQIRVPESSRSRTLVLLDDGDAKVESLTSICERLESEVNDFQGSLNILDHTTILLKEENQFLRTEKETMKNTLKSEIDALKERERKQVNDLEVLLTNADHDYSKQRDEVKSLT